MLGTCRKLLVAGLLGLAAACSLDGAIEAMSSEQDRAMAREFVESIRQRDAAALQAMVDPQLWRRSAAQFEQAAGLFPRRTGETRLIGYRFNAQANGGASRTEKEFTLVTSDEAHWTTTRFTTVQQGGSEPMVVEWHVEGAEEPPVELEAMETVGAVFMWTGIAALVLLAGLVLLVVWLVRRSRRSREGDPVS